MSDPTAFPPKEISVFLRFCAGEWICLNSAFALNAVPMQPEDVTDDDATDADDNGWHSSERGELVVTYIEPATPGEPGGLGQGPKGGGVSQELVFDSAGYYRCGAAQGRWQLWPDGSLELVLKSDSTERRERIWFTKPNLRLRSSVDTRGDGCPSQALFSSEIRRVSKT